MFTRILTSALFAGFAAGLIAALLQFLFVQPVLLHAELYETGAKLHFGADGSSADGVAWSFDALRDGLSILFSTLVYTGYGLILVALMAAAHERGIEITTRQGLIWGIAGFITVHFAPAFGLPPEVPGVAAADVGVRQFWWFMCVTATGAGLGFFAFGKNLFAYAIGVVLILTPHIVGAPHPDTFLGTVPPELSSLFVTRSLGVGLATWSLLGLLAAYFWNSEISSEEA